VIWWVWEKYSIDGQEKDRIRRAWDQAREGKHGGKLDAWGKNWIPRKSHGAIDPALIRNRFRGEGIAYKYFEKRGGRGHTSMGKNKGRGSGNQKMDGGGGSGAPIGNGIIVPQVDPNASVSSTNPKSKGEKTV